MVFVPTGKVWRAGDPPRMLMPKRYSSLQWDADDRDSSALHPDTDFAPLSDYYDQHISVEFLTNPGPIARGSGETIPAAATTATAAGSPAPQSDPAAGSGNQQTGQSTGVILAAPHIGDEVEISKPVEGTPITAAPPVDHNVTFNLVNVGGVTPGSSAEAGFQRAAALWQSFLGDAVTIRLDVGFSALGAGILGSTGSTSKVVSYSAVRTALIADQTSGDDAAAVASLSAGTSFSFYTDNQAGTRVFDNDGSANNTYLDVNTANLKALGITTDANGQAVDTGAADGNITFSSNFSWDFDSSDGITAGMFDFVGVAFHEIGHALGFVSGVDIVDYYSGSGPGAQLNLNPYAVFNTLDLFRYSSSGVRDLSYGGSTYFSLNGGATNRALFSTGDFQGDGNQASHWKDNLGIGIMDPTLGSGQKGIVTALDILAMDVIGWNVAGSSSGPGSVAISDASVTEGNSGTRAMTFTVTRSGGTAAFALGFATANGSATTADNDYLAIAGNLSFAANETVKTISVTINGDTRIEPDETFSVILSGPTNGATISDGTGAGTIVSDDINHAPVVALPSGANVGASSRTQVFALSSLFTASDADNQPLSYMILDNTVGSGSGHFNIAGVAQREGGWIGVSAAQLSQITFTPGLTRSDDLYFYASDGIASDLKGLNLMPAQNYAPVVSLPSGANIGASSHGQSFALSSLFTAADPNNDALAYMILDNTPGSGSGHFNIAGVAQLEGGWIGVTAAQLSQVTFTPGLTRADDLYFYASDGITFDLKGLNLMPAPNHAPVIALPSGANVAASSQSVPLSSLFAATDADNDALMYMMLDNTTGSGSGHFNIGGVAQAEGGWIGVTAAQLSQIAFAPGSGRADDLYFYASDGIGFDLKGLNLMPPAGSHATAMAMAIDLHAHDYLI